NAVDPQRAAVVRLHEDTDGVAVDDAGRRADAAFPTEAGGAGPRADRPLLDGTVRGGGDRVEHVFLGDVSASDVVEHTVVRLPDHRVHRRDRLVPRLGERPGDGTVDTARDAQRVREDDRGLDRAEFGHLGGAGQPPDRVADEHTTGYLLLIDVAGLGDDRGDPGPHVVTREHGHLS